LIRRSQNQNLCLSTIHLY